MKKILFIVLLGAVGVVGWWLGKKSGRPAGPAASGARKVAYYQSPMHPWILSKEPGRCTICGMKLEPVMEGERGFTAEEGIVTLGSNSIQAIHVQTELVTNRALVRTLRVAGVIDSDDTKHRRLSAYAEGRIEKLLVNYVGAEVTAGQPLAVFYSPSLLAAESEYLVVLNQETPTASDALQQERSRMLEAAGQRLRRLGYSEAQIAALARKDSAEARTQIAAPISGTVVSRNVYEGQYVKEGDILFELSDFSTMWFQFDAYERDLSWLQPGQTIQITAPALPGKVFTAPIQFIDPNLNDMTRSARVRVELPNPVVDEGTGKRRLLLRRMYADGIVTMEAPTVLAVPRTAVLSAGEPVVYVDLGGGAYEQRKVKLGRVGDALWEILAGVNVGEKVVTTGNLMVDAQAQLNTLSGKISAAPASEPATSTSTNTSGMAEPSPANLGPAQQSTIRRFLQLTSDLGAALAADDLNRFNSAAPLVHASVPDLLTAAASMRALRPTLQRLEETGHFENAANLGTARKAFLPFSMAAADLAKSLRSQDSFKNLRVYNCPMVNRAIPGAAKNGQWIQMDPPLRNPFFGAEMLDCGTEVK